MLGTSMYGSLDGVLTSSFDSSTGRALFPDLNITGFGMYYVQFRVVSDPPDFNFTFNHKLNIKNPAHVGMTIEEEYEIKVRNDTLKTKHFIRSKLEKKHLKSIVFFAIM